MYRSIQINLKLVLISFLWYVSCVGGENCFGPLYQQWCPGKPNHILCVLNNDIHTSSSVVRKTDIKLIVNYSNYFKRNTICNQINNDTVKLNVDDYLRGMAVTALSNDLWYHNDICYAKPFHPNVRLIHYSTLSSNTYSIDALTSLMNIRAVGCANSDTELLCLFSDDDPFKHFRKFVVNNDDYCGLDYDKFNSGICYIRNETAITIINQLKTIKAVQWNVELEYLAQGAIASNTTNLCYTKDRRQIKLSSINYHVDEINEFNVTTIIHNMIRNGVFNVLKDSEDYSLGCTFYDLQQTSLRILCVYDILLVNKDVLNTIVAWHGYLKTMANDNTIVIYGLVILVYANILILLLCMRILRKFRSLYDDEIYSMQPIYSAAQ